VPLTRYLMNYDRTQTSFYNYFRMSVSSSDELHRRLDSLQRRNSKIRNCNQPVEMLAIESSN